ncbi:MAG: sulfite exporter TauE/SafE family protein [Stellaceae bacterium]
MGTFWLVLLGAVSGAGAGLLAGLIGIGGGIVIVPVVFYGLVETGTSADQAAHVAVGTSLAAILPAALVSSLAHWRAGNTDIRFLRDWGPGIAIGGRCRAASSAARSRQCDDRAVCVTLPDFRYAVCLSQPVCTDS